MTRLGSVVVLRVAAAMAGDARAGLDPRHPPIDVEPGDDVTDVPPGARP